MYSPDLNESIVFEYHSMSSAQNVYQNMLSNKSVSFTYWTKRGSVIFGFCESDIVEQGTSVTIFPPAVSITRKFLKKIMLKKIE